jgi:selenocysteine-specific elongation factor
MPSGALARTLGLPDAALLAALLAETDLRLAGGRVAGAPAETLGPAENAVRELERRFADEPFAAPEQGELAAARLGRRELAAAERSGRLIRITEDIVLPPDAPERAVQLLAGLPQPFTASAARQALGTTRRVAIPLLEYLDRAGRTERVDGQTRRIRDAG